MLGSQYGLEQLQIWFHRCLHFYVHIYFTRLNELLLALIKWSCMKVFCRQKSLDSYRQELCYEFSLEAGVHLLLCGHDTISPSCLASMGKGLHPKKRSGRRTWNTRNKGMFLCFLLCVSVSRWGISCFFCELKILKSPQKCSNSMGIFKN